MSSNLTPMLEQYHRIKREHRDSILMFRMGDFYEMFFEDARKASGILEIALTARGKGTENEAPMCGVPHHSVDSYIARLIASGLKVAVCDQVEDASKARGLVRREVVRVVSPGTLTDPSALEAGDNLYIGCLFPARGGVGAAFIDLSTGDFRLAESDGERAWEQASLLLSVFRPREILQPGGDEPRLAEIVGGDAASGITFNPLDPSAFGLDAAYRVLTDQMGTTSLEGFGCEGMRLAIRAGGALLRHLRDTQRSSLSHIDRVLPYRASECMVLDPPTQRTLELTRSLIGNSVKGSLLGVLDRTLTPLGARRLRAWIVSPLLNVETIERRQEAVAELVADGARRQALRLALEGIRDIERLLGRITLGSANARDLVSLRESLAPLPRIAGLTGELTSYLLSGETSGPSGGSNGTKPLDPLTDLHDILARAIDDDPAATTREGRMIRPAYDPELDELRRISTDGASTIAAMQARERERTGIASLKVRYNKIFGYYIEVSRANLKQVPPDYERKQTLVNAERFSTPELKRHEEKVLTAQERIEQMEYEIFCRVKDAVAERAVRLKTTARRIADLDALSSLAEVALARNYTRPRIAEGGETRILEGRHPVVEDLDRAGPFVPNDAILGQDSRILIVTGPNMGGKSTYLRQVALITLMAQIGSFVPAREAEIGIVDRIFSRIGSSDNLAGGQSTFMVEMQETANIMHNATHRSLILLDEVGRGTSTFDGLSLAWAIVEYLHDMPGRAANAGPRVLFATHYHELTELALTLSGVVNLTVSVVEKGQDVVFLRRIVNGAADRSYGIQVARLAGLPRRVIDRAREILVNLENNEFGRDGMPKLARHGIPGLFPAGGPSQLGLFGAGETGYSEVIEEVLSLDPENLTPREALETLYRLKRRLAGSD